MSVIIIDDIMKHFLCKIYPIVGIFIACLIWQLSSRNNPATANSLSSSEAKLRASKLSEDKDPLTWIKPVIEQVTNGLSTGFKVHSTRIMETNKSLDEQHGNLFNAQKSRIEEHNTPHTESGIAVIGNSSLNKAYKSILFWNTFFGKVDYSVGLGSQALKHLDCPVHHCTITANRSELYSADVVVVHGYHLHEYDKPKRIYSYQVFLYYIYENPMQTKKFRNLSHFNDFFNLTFSYLDHPDTDICVTSTGTAKRDAPDPEAVPSIDILQSKTKSILWIASNCHPLSARVEYAKKLSEYIPIDIFGKCGNMSCPGGPGKSNPECTSILSKQYMFYLSFENTYCQDYHTEKVWNPLRYDLVPITMGGANYSKYLPPNSYIDVGDFESPKQLADRLKYLKDHPDEYMKYFQWRKDYYIEDGCRQFGFCQLCEILSTPNYAYKSKFKIEQYWNPDAVCLNKTEHINKLNVERS